VGRAASLLSLVAVVASLAACGGGGSSSSSGGSAQEPSAADRKGAVLSIYGFGAGDDVAANRAKVAKAAIAPATIKNPEGAFNPQQFLTRLASSDTPDIIYVDRQQIATLAAQGALQPLDQCVSDQSIDTSQYNKAAIAEVTYQGKLYALPEFTNQRTLIVNDVAAADAGIKPTDVQTTDWAKLKVVAKKMTRVSGGQVTRIGFDPKIPEFFIMWAKANGADLVSKDGLKVNFTDPKVVEALTYTKSLIDEQGGWDKFKAFRDTWDFFGAKNQVAEDQVGAWPMESWYWNVMAESSPNVKVTAVPFTDRHGKPLTFISGSGWAIPKGAKNTGLACTWMKTITSVKAWMTAAKARAAATQAKGQVFTGLYTANNTADKRILDEVYQPSSPAYDRAVKLLVDVQKNAVAFPASPAGTRVQQALTDAINRVLVGSQSPQASLARAQKEAQQAIDEAQSKASS
jgi:multiple sugar transport system substrate-binding protein